MKVHGYVIAQPSIFRGSGNGFIPHYHTFAETPAAAWRYHIGANVKEIDVSTYIQRWHDRGYRVKKATMEMEIEE